MYTTHFKPNLPNHNDKKKVLKMKFGQIDRQTVIKNTVLSGFTGTGTKKSSPPNIHSMQFFQPTPWEKI